jgi:hypothetical protein
MEPAPGQPVSLLEWIARMRLATDSGDRVARGILAAAKLVGAISAIAAALAAAWAFIRFGHTR